MPPWEKYQKGNGSTGSGPWSKYAQAQPQERRMTGEQMAQEYNLPVPGMMTPDPPKPQILRSPIPGGDFLNQVGTDLATNIPVVGPLVERASNAMGSAAVSAATGRPYDEALNERERINQMRRDEQPVASAIGTVAGTVGPLMRVAQTPMGGQALGTSGTLPQRLMAGAASGGLLSGLDTFARGGSAQDSFGAGAVGAALGTAFPLAERGLSAVARALMASDADRAAFTLSRGMERDRIDPRNMQQSLDAIGPDAVPADLGRNTRRQAAAIAATPGRGQTVVADALVERNLGSNARIQGDVNTTLGPTTSPMQFNQGIRDAQKALSPQYEAVLTNARPVDVANIANKLDSLEQDFTGDIGSALAKVRAMLDDKSVQMPKAFGQALDVQAPLISDPRRLLNVRHDLDDLVAAAKGNQRRVLRDVRQMIDDELAQAAPGIKDVDRQYEALAKQREGFEQGQQALDSGRTALTPVDLQGLASASPQEVMGAMTQGARAEIDRIIGTTANNVTALKTALKGDGSWNRDRLVTLFGRDKADRLLNILERESTYQRTYNDILSNSETAARQAAQKDVSPRQFGERPTSIVDLLMRIPQAGANAAARSRSEAVNQQIAEALMSRPTPELVDRLIAARAANRGTIGVAPVPLLTNQ